MDGHQWSSGAPNSDHGLPRQHSRNTGQTVSASAARESAERGGARAMSFSNSTSTPWPGTAISSPQEAEAQNYEPSWSSSTRPFLSAAYTPYTTNMNNDNRTIDPRYLTLRPFDSQGPSDLQPEDRSASSNVLGDFGGASDESSLYSPLGYAFGGLALPGSSPTAATTPSSAGTSHFSHMTSHEAPHSPLSARNQTMSNEEYWGYQSGTMPPFSLQTDYSELIPNTALSREPARLEMMRGHDASMNMRHSRWPGNDVRGDELTRQYNPTGQPINVPYGPYQNPEVPIASSSSSTTRATPQRTAGASSRAGSHPHNINRPSRRARSPKPKTLTTTLVSTGDGFQNRMYNPEFAPSLRSPFAQSETGAAGPGISPVFEHPAGPSVEQARMVDRGKGKLILHVDDERTSVKPANEPSPSSSRNRARNTPKPYAKKKKAPAIKRAQPTRPQEIVCPLSDCGQSIFNTFGSIQLHVDTCRSSSVRSIQESQGRKKEQTQASPARITCPTCTPIRTYARLSRWADHLRNMHGEWGTYECEVEWCSEEFVCEKDCNLHMRLEH